MGANGNLPGYLAVPDGRGPWPGVVVVVQDVLGMTANLRQISDRFAHNGYLALAPALYDGRDPKIGCVISTIRAHLAGHGRAHDDLVAARDHLIADERCTGKVGLAGFCMGAGFVLQLASRGLFNATAPNYGLLPKDVGALRESCPLVGSFGGKDPIVRRGTAARLEAILAEGDVPRDIKEYPGVGHSFMNDHSVPAPIRIIAGLTGMAYSEPEAEDAWRRMVTFFDEHLK
ncbi:dienelactone hydrolase family protein [Mycobacterium paraense]|uniref:dienelactone hydrolase family protein n=1 Tax=Mycobacterium paraense TaxID=767916 RepID=UPI001F4E07DA|nr:dienelactone hydrolase family protein [Mycobacterium paraense]